MSIPVHIDEFIYNEARKTAKAECRTIALQIEYWAKIGKAALDNPELPIEFKCQHSDKSISHYITIKNWLLIKPSKYLLKTRRVVKKKDDLQDVYVYKFNGVNQEYLVAYEYDATHRLLLALGRHENFYRDLKRKK